MTFGPTLKISKEIHAEKYRSVGESFKEAMSRVAGALQDSPQHYFQFRDALLHQRFLPAGRVQASVGSPRATTAYNCFVSGTIEDSMDDIMDKAKEAATTMRLGGGIGYDFSTLRPRGALIKSLDSKSSGPISFMEIFDAVCGTVASAGHRRGAQMGVLRIDHPDIEEFIRTKQNSNHLTNFNISVGVTDDFIDALNRDSLFDLTFEGVVYKRVSAKALWDELMRSTWDWAEPGVLFIDTINKKNNLWYCEEITATNPCAEQPLGPYSACLLGSFNLVKYLYYDEDACGYDFSWVLFEDDIVNAVRAMDNIIDRTIYPLEEQKVQAQSKRRMGLGVTGVANALETMGLPYASNEFLEALDDILRTLRDTAYAASIDLAREKGPFPYFDKEKYLQSEFIQTLPKHLQDAISIYGIRNSHLLSIAPTGTISLTADNISSGIEPVFTHKYTRTIMTSDGVINEEVSDYAYREFGVKGRTADEVRPQEHVDVLVLASYYVDSAVSKTCNIGPEVTWEEFKDVYLQAYEGGASGCTTFRSAGKRYGILNKIEETDTIEIAEGAACFIDPNTGKKTCE